MESTLEQSLADVYAQLRWRAGIDPESLGPSAIAHAVRKRFAGRPRGLSAVDFDDLLDELLVPETWFFRDVSPFHYLREVAERGRRPRGAGAFRALSVACSTGEEAYSIAMILEECGLGAGRSEVLAVDLCRRALDTAGQAVYGQRSLRETDKGLGALFQQYFERVGDAWRARPGLRQRVRFCRDNLADAAFLAGEPAFSAIFCRNVLIYFHPEARRIALRTLARLLEPGGVVVCGHCEGQIFAQGGFRHASAAYPCAFVNSEGQAMAHLPVPLAGNAPPTRMASLIGPSVVAPPAFRVEEQPPQNTVPTSPERSKPEPSREAAAADRLAGLLQAAGEAADSGRLAEGDALCRQILAADPSCAEGHYLLGVIRQAQGIDDDARQLLDRALYLAPEHYRALVHRMLLAQRCGDFAAAENYQRRARRVAAKEVT